MHTMRKGVVLFITLSVIAAMLAMVGLIFTYLEKVKNNASYTSALIQADLLFHDSMATIDTLMKKNAKDKEAKKTVLDTLYLAPVTLQAAKNEEMFTTLECKPLDRGVNINWLGLENNSSARQLYNASQTVFDKLVEAYNIQNPARLLSLIKTAIDGQNSQDTQSQGGLEHKKGIIKLSQVEDIARDYRFEEDDSAIEKIVWEQYFSFDLHGNRMDGDFLSAELVSLLFDIEIDAVREEWSEGGDLKEFVVSQGGDMALFNGKVFATEPIERMGCRISYGYQGNVYALGFEYLEGKAEKFEFYGQQ